MHFYILAFVVSIVLVGCGDHSKLSRSKSEHLIQDKLNSDRITGEIGVGEKIPASWDGYDPTHRADGADHPLIAVLEDLARRNLITFAHVNAAYPNEHPFCDIHLTENGKKYFIMDDIINKKVIVELCKHKVVDVTGIEQPAPNISIVHFKYSTSNRTPFGEAAPKKCSYEIRGGKAVFALFDDGWRLDDLVLR